MIAADEDLLICDFAETYHILNYKSLPLKLAATLAYGLGDDSRIKLKISQSKVNPEILLLADIVDRLSVLVWQNTEDGHKNINRPQMLVEKLIGEPKESENEIMSFNSPEDFENMRNALISRL